MKKSLRTYACSYTLVLFSALVLPVGTSCSRIPEKNGEEPIVRVYDKYLFTSDMSGIFQGVSNPADSARMARLFIDQWIKRQVMLRLAELNVLEEEKQFESLIEDYRSSLLIYEYEKQLVREKVDTVVSMSQLEEYYNNNLNAFHLETPIIKALYIRIEKSNVSVPEIRRLINSSRDQDFEQLVTLGQKEADRFDFFDDKWVSFSKIMEKIPGQPENDEEFLRRNKLWESSDDDYIHFLLIRDNLMAGEQSPIEYIETTIKGLVLSKRKIDYIKQIEKEVFQDALSQQQIEIYE